MDCVAKEDLAALAGLTDDDFLSAWDASLKHLAEAQQIQQKLCPYWQVATGKQDEKVRSGRVMNRVMVALGRLAEGSASEQDLTSYFTSSGLQPPRVTLVLSQLERLQQLTSSGIHLKPRERLLDLQWKFGVVAGSSREGEAGRTFVQVQFTSTRTSDSSDHPKTSSRVVEMTLQDFYNFLHQLEKCKASLELMNCL